MWKPYFFSRLTQPFAITHLPTLGFASCSRSAYLWGKVGWECQLFAGNGIKLISSLLDLLSDAIQTTQTENRRGWTLYVSHIKCIQYCTKKGDVTLGQNRSLNTAPDIQIHRPVFQGSWQFLLIHMFYHAIFYHWKNRLLEERNEGDTEKA